jgi:hypothetical protein
MAGPCRLSARRRDPPSVAIVDSERSAPLTRTQDDVDNTFTPDERTPWNR